MGKQARRKQDGTWRKEGSESVMKAEGTQDIRTYINRNQIMVSQWVVLRTIFEACMREMGYEGGGRSWDPW